MLVKITTQCQMGCTHCMEEAEPAGDFMSMEVFNKAVAFIERVYKGLQFIMISGGEPTEHPQIFEFLEKVKDWKVILLSNGLFLLNPELKEKLLASGAFIQIYNDPMFYPIHVDPFEHPDVLFSTKINLLSPFGRAKKNNLKTARCSPLCFNLRSFTRGIRDLPEAIFNLRKNGKMCSPAVNVNGDITAGECRLCYKIGTVDSSNAELANALLSMRCNKCGLEDNLSPVQRQAIGLS